MTNFVMIGLVFAFIMCENERDYIQKPYIYYANECREMD